LFGRELAHALADLGQRAFAAHRVHANRFESSRRPGGNDARQGTRRQFLYGFVKHVMEVLIVARGGGMLPSVRCVDNIGMALEFTTSHLQDSLSLFRYYKKLAEDAMEQVTDAELSVTLDGEMNSIALIVKHMAGNMRSRWTDFLTTDGEKPNRQRDSEFVQPPATRAELMKLWEEGWASVWRALGPLEETDLARTVTIRGENHSVMQAINRQLAHYPYHIGQIVMLAKHFRGEQWKSLTVPKNKSAEFNQKVAAGEKSQRERRVRRHSTATLPPTPSRCESSTSREVGFCDPNAADLSGGGVGKPVPTRQDLS